MLKITVYYYMYLYSNNLNYLVPLYRLITSAETVFVGFWAEETSNITGFLPVETDGVFLFDELAILIYCGVGLIVFCVLIVLPKGDGAEVFVLLYFVSVGATITLSVFVCTLSDIILVFWFTVVWLDSVGFDSI